MIQCRMLPGQKGAPVPALPRMVKVVYVTDREFLRPTLVSVWSLLQTLTGPAELHIWGSGFDPGDWAEVEQVVAGHDQVILRCKDISSGYLDGAHGPTDYISAATMGRLFIPRLIDGYVLYIDGDTLVTRDVSALFDINLGDALAGVVQDYHISQWLSEPGTASAERAVRLQEIRQFMAPLPPRHYFNAGVLLFNSDGLRSRPELLSRIEDVAAASACTHGDQDHLNALLKDAVVPLDPAWNASWGRVRRHRGLLTRSGLPREGLAPGRAAIIHYHGPQKPWRDTRWDVWSSRGRATLVYRHALRRFLRTYPHLGPL